MVWTIPSPCPGMPGFRCCPSSLYTFPVRGLARDCHLTGFPEFGQFYSPRFREGTQDRPKSVASTSSATPATPLTPIVGYSSVDKAILPLPRAFGVLVSGFLALRPIAGFVLRTLIADASIIFLMCEA